MPEEIKTFNRNGIMFIGDKGRVFVNRGGVYGKPVEELKENPLPDDAWRVRPSSDHMGNFFDCVKTREEPVSPVRIQHRTITACHLTNISLRLGRKLTWDPETRADRRRRRGQRLARREQRARTCAGLRSGPRRRVVSAPRELGASQSHRMIDTGDALLYIR